MQNLPFKMRFQKRWKIFGWTCICWEENPHNGPTFQFGPEGRPLQGESQRWSLPSEDIMFKPLILFFSFILRRTHQPQRCPLPDGSKKRAPWGLTFSNFICKGQETSLFKHLSTKWQNFPANNFLTSEDCFYQNQPRYSIAWVFHFPDKYVL